MVSVVQIFGVCIDALGDDKFEMESSTFVCALICWVIMCLRWRAAHCLMVSVAQLFSHTCWDYV